MIDPIVVTGAIFDTMEVVVSVAVGNIGVMLLLLVDGAVTVEIAAGEEELINEVKGTPIGGGAHWGFFLRRTFRAI